MRILLAVVMLMSLSCMDILFRHADTAKTSYMKDPQGRVIVYHGLNVANYAKHCNNGTEGVTWHTEEDFRRMQSWGFNLARYLVFWNALEPVDGTYDQEYIRKTVENIQALHRSGIDVLVDIHQDVFSSKFLGNGFPKWMVYDEGMSFTHREPWTLNLLEPAVMASYANFWKRPDLQDRYVQMVAKVLEIVDTIPGVIGIDVMNEPYPGYAVNFEKEGLLDLYNNLQTKVFIKTRKHMFFEPWMSTSAGIPSRLLFKPSPNAVYAPHFYDPLCDQGKPYEQANWKLMDKAVDIKLCEAQDMGIPVLFGEFGIDSTPTNYLKFLNDFCTRADQYCFGWTYWSYDMYGHSNFGVLYNDKSPRPHIKQLVRIYAQRIAGEKPSCQNTEGKFELRYEATGLSAPTEIFIPAEDSLIRLMMNGQERATTSSITTGTYFDGRILYIPTAFTGSCRVDVYWTKKP